MDTSRCGNLEPHTAIPRRRSPRHSLARQDRSGLEISGQADGSTIKALGHPKSGSESWNRGSISTVKGAGSSSALLKDRSNDGSDDSEEVGSGLEFWAFTVALASEPSLHILLDARS